MYRPATSYYFRNIISINPQRCLRCLQCLSACPRKVLVVEDGQVRLRDKQRCAGCLICEAQCAMKAISHKTIPA